ncbi:MAG: hypothetical protein UHD09_09095 [Bifidobacterium sp.]|nr:hypothetical protein [Bifidobacterium sp.]
MPNPIYTTHSTTDMAMTTTTDTDTATVAKTATVTATMGAEKPRRARRRPHPGRMERYRRQVRRLQVENNLLHAKLAAIYDALNLTADDLDKEPQ